MATDIRIGTNMVAPLVGIAIGAVARFAAKKAAQQAAKKAAQQAAKKAARNNKRFGVGQSRPATKAEISATTAKYKANTARTMSSDKVAKNSVKVKPAAKRKPNKPNPSKIEYKFGMGINRARAKGNDPLLTNPGRKYRIQVNKLKKSK